MRAAVVDASVAIKWVIAEEYSEQALTLLGGTTLLAPAHWQAEAVNALWGQVARGAWLPEDAISRVAALHDAPVDPVPLAPLLKRALELSLDLRSTTYDTLYVALAEVRGIPFVTDDRKLVRRMRAVGMSELVIPIEDISPP